MSSSGQASGPQQAPQVNHQPELCCVFTITFGISLTVSDFLVWSSVWPLVTGEIIAINSGRLCVGLFLSTFYVLSLVILAGKICSFSIENWLESVLYDNFIFTVSTVWCICIVCTGLLQNVCLSLTRQQQLMCLSPALRLTWRQRIFLVLPRRSFTFCSYFFTSRLFPKHCSCELGIRGIKTGVE